MENCYKEMLLVVFFIGFLTLVGWIYTSYQTDKKLSIKHLVVAFLFAFISAQVASWVMKETDFFEKAIQVLKQDKSIQSHIGEYNGHMYNQRDLPSPEANPAEVKVTLHGSQGSVYIHCRMELDKQGEWRLKEILTKEEK